MPAGFDGLMLFSSHSWAHGGHRVLLHERLQEAWLKGVDFWDLSAPCAHPIHNARERCELGAALRERLRACDVFLVFTGMYADSYWINFEVNVAFALGKPIIPIAYRGQQKHSTVATDFASRDLVHWNGNSIRRAILDHVDPQKRAVFEQRLADREAYREALLHRRRNESLVQTPPRVVASPVIGGLPPLLTNSVRSPRSKW